MSDRAGSLHRIAAERFVDGVGCQERLCVRQIPHRRLRRSGQDNQTAAHRRSPHQESAGGGLKAGQAAEFHSEWPVPEPATTNVPDKVPCTAARSRSAYGNLPVVTGSSPESVAEHSMRSSRYSGRCLTCS